MESLKDTTCKCSQQNTLNKTSKKDGKKISILNILSGVLLFLFPKCPLCWAAYASLFSFVGLENVPYNSNWSYIILGLFLLGSFFLLRKYYLNKFWFSIILYCLGMLLLVTSYYLNFNETWWLYLILGLIVLSNLSIRYNQKFIKLFKNPFLVST